MLRTVWWITPVIAVILICAAIVIPMGAWIIAKSRLPLWAKGIWKWPMGDNLSATVARQLGLGLLLVGSAGLLLVVVVLRMAFHDLGFWVAWVATALLLVLGLVVYARSVTLSNRKPTD
jgi:hypothetical protein